ncbi:Flp pilus assembly protein CpaB [Xenophilus sp. Marseille-Q4582]|uniref:Flp pilus assembly protein CpaB n=1 Tax=Xenophilus sp. Marseille-Q4582 TaxID=2866600 RepID=UPI001CE4A1A7|nr:Flp pilus assembly protein CpaB [Xenophilus sp. Marseille-Q4582]
MSIPASSPKSRLLLLAAAIGLAALAAFLVHLYLTNMSDRLRAEFADKDRDLVGVVVARTDVPRNAVVDTGNFAVRQVAADLVPPDAVFPEDIERAEGQTLKLDLPRGRSLQWGYLSSGATPSFSDSIQSDKRALTIAVDELNSISGMIRPNDRIDLFYIAESVQPQGGGGSGNNRVVVPLLQNIFVKATGNITRREVPPGGGEPVERQYSTLTLDLSPSETGRVILAQEQGALRAVLKHATDAKSPGYAITTAADLLGAAGQPRPSGALVAMYVGGQQGGVLLPQLVMPGTPTMNTGLPAAPGRPAAGRNAPNPPGAPALAGPAPSQAAIDPAAWTPTNLAGGPAAPAPAAGSE